MYLGLNLSFKRTWIITLPPGPHRIFRPSYGPVRIGILAVGGVDSYYIYLLFCHSILVLFPVVPKICTVQNFLQLFVVAQCRIGPTIFYFVFGIRQIVRFLDFKKLFGFLIDVASDSLLVLLAPTSNFEFFKILKTTLGICCQIWWTDCLCVREFINNFWYPWKCFTSNCQNSLRIHW